MRTLTALIVLVALAACDAPDIDQARQQAAELGGQALEAASGVVDTRTACHH